jgi:hypothetical protein
MHVAATDTPVAAQAGAGQPLRRTISVVSQPANAVYPIYGAIRAAAGVSTPAAADV